MFEKFQIYSLIKDLAEKYVDDIIAALNLIPEIDKHNINDVLSEKKGERILHAKWKHSLIVLTADGEFVGVIIGYEREKEDNNQYPENSIYLNDLAVNGKFQKRGVGKFLTMVWLDWNKKIGFIELTGKLRFSVQTNKQDWNSHVQKLYEAVGFKKIAEKNYNNRTDNVYSLNI